MTMAWKYSDMQHDHFLDFKGDKDIFKCRRIGFVHKIQVLQVDQIICGEHNACDIAILKLNMQNVDCPIGGHSITSALHDNDF